MVINISKTNYMALPNYGVAIGTFNSFEREPANNFGKWYHGFIYLNANGVIFKCAVDVNSPSGNFAFMRLLGLDPSMFTNISGLADGYHELSGDPVSGAIDYNRSPFVNKAKGCLTFLFALILSFFGKDEKVWNTDTGDNILNYLRDMVVNSERIYVFGAPFTDGDNGMHDVHYNQGDPSTSQWFDSNGIWQDGCVIIKKPGIDTLYGYFGMFLSQSTNTDNNGNPL
jgi:hypothetical protein